MADSTNITDFILKTNEKIRFLDQNNDAFFLCSMGVVIFLMQCGFAFLEAGAVRSKNTTNILIKNLLDSCISAICYWLLGWAFAYGEPSNTFIGHGQFALKDMEPNLYKNWFFQFVFAAAASTIVSGALAERCEFVAYFAYCILLTTFVYPVITHWVWSPNGWLTASAGILRDEVGMKDFAGSGVVHVHGGACALVGAFILGPRIGRFNANGQPMRIQGHSIPFAALGGFLLMFGFFAFNGGSQISITNNGDGQVVALAMVNTMISGGAAAIAGLLLNLFTVKNWSLLMSINSALAGMVAICSGCDALYPWGAFVTGIGAAVSCIVVSHLVLKFKIDDPLDAVGVHLGGGLWGLLSSPFLINGGIFYGGPNSGLILAMNCIGAAAIIVWSIFWIGGLFWILKLFKIFRVSAEVEIKGLDRAKHGEDAYPLLSYGHGWSDDESEVQDPHVKVTVRHNSLPMDVPWKSRESSPVQSAQPGPWNVNGGVQLREQNKQYQPTDESDSERVSTTNRNHSASPRKAGNRNSTTSSRDQRVYPTRGAPMPDGRSHGEVYYPESMYHATYPTISPRPGSYPGWYNYYR